VTFAGIQNHCSIIVFLGQLIVIQQLTSFLRDKYSFLMYSVDVRFSRVFCNRPQHATVDYFTYSTSFCYPGLNERVGPEVMSTLPNNDWTSTSLSFFFFDFLASIRSAFSYFAQFGL
jgi:hypothetical protein